MAKPGGGSQAQVSSEDPSKSDKTAAAGTGHKRPSELTGPEYWLTWAFAVGLVVLFVVACAILYHLADSPRADEVHWHRYVFVFSAFEAIVFTAVGWVFGREVHRSTAERAIADADDHRAEAKNASDEAKNGYALAQAIKGSVAALGGVEAMTDAPHAPTALPSHLLALKKMADQLYP